MVYPDEYMFSVMSGVRLVLSVWGTTTSAVVVAPTQQSDKIMHAPTDMIDRLYVRYTTATD